MRTLIEGIPFFLLGSFYAIWRHVHQSPGLPRMPDGTPYHPRRIRENGYTSDSGSSGPYR